MADPMLISSYLILALSVIGVAVASYLLGCLNGAVIVSKYILKNDIRSHGSGNAGLTNFYRVFGGKLTLVVILTDMMKAVFAVLIGMAVFGAILNAPDVGKYMGGMFCMIGHMFPLMFGFKGGKGILSGGTLALMLDWRVTLVVWGGFLLLSALTKWISLGSIWAGGSLPFISWFVYQEPLILLCSAVCGVLIVWKHRGNLRRILRGEESKFSFHRKKETK
ncbi:MAG: Acyl-phosphate:glycerol-3-phosphate O-acyltransferase PlsY [Oscillospiraceae bacterium]|nr:Acyl-phosphate:glycerol-3-phosphate O-acyltransferase PlsY [Oscillospiraceae bacterium]